MQPMSRNTMNYMEDDEKILKDALVSMELLDPRADLPKPYRITTGVANKSRVYFLFIPGSATTGINLVAKFDKPDRALREWAAINQIFKSNSPIHAMLPWRNNQKEHGVVIYRDASGQAESGKVYELDDLLT